MRPNLLNCQRVTLFLLIYQVFLTTKVPVPVYLAQVRRVPKGLQELLYLRWKLQEKLALSWEPWVGGMQPLTKSSTLCPVYLRYPPSLVTPSILLVVPRSKVAKCKWPALQPLGLMRPVSVATTSVAKRIPRPLHWYPERVPKVLKMFSWPWPTVTMPRTRTSLMKKDLFMTTTHLNLWCPFLESTINALAGKCTFAIHPRRKWPLRGSGRRSMFAWWCNKATCPASNCLIPKIPKTLFKRSPCNLLTRCQTFLTKSLTSTPRSSLLNCSTFSTKKERAYVPDKSVRCKSWPGNWDFWPRLWKMQTIRASKSLPATWKSWECLWSMRLKSRNCSSWVVPITKIWSNFPWLLKRNCFEWMLCVIVPWRIKLKRFN